MITLPKSWIEKNGLKKNDPVFLMPQKDGSLVIIPRDHETRKSEVKEIKINEEMNRDLLFRCLVATYMSGVYSIRVTAERKIDAEMREAVRTFTLKAIGQEILEEGENHIVMKNLLNPVEMPLDNIIKRMFILSKNMAEDAIRSLMSRDRRLAEDVISRDDEVDRLYWLLVRQHNIISENPAIAEKLKIDQMSSSHYSLAGRLIERAADHVARIAKNVIALIGEELREDDLRKISQASELSLEILRNSVESFLSGDLKRANETIERLEDLFELYQEIQFRALGYPPSYAIALSNVSESVKRIGEYGRGICEQAINHVVGFDS